MYKLTVFLRSVKNKNIDKSVLKYHSLTMQEEILLFFKDISTPTLDKFAEIITMLGEQYFFIIVISFLFWNISKREGFKLSVAFIYSAMINAVLKIAFHSPRPFEKLDFIQGKRVETATGYSFPSGHTQSSTTFFITLSQIIRRRWFTMVSIILIIFIGISRIYLGVHWPADVIGGIVLGIILSYIFCSIVDNYYDDISKLRKIFFRIQAVFVLGTIILFFIDLFILKGSMKIEDFFKISGISTGAVYGFFLEERYTDFSPEDAGWFRKIIRFIIGLALTMVLMSGLKLILPEYILSDFFRYGLVGLWITFLWPAAGTGLKLFNKTSRVQ